MEHFYIGLFIFLAVMFFGTANIVKIKNSKTTLEKIVALEEEAYKERTQRFRFKKMKIRFFKKLIIKAHQAGLKVGEAEIILAVFICAGGAYFLLSTLFSSKTVGLIGIPIGIYLPINILQGMVRKRGELLAKQLVGCLQMWANSIRSGASLAQAIAASIDRLPNEINEELKRIKYDIDLGNSAAKALEMALERIPVAEFKMVAMTARIHKQLGGNLAERFENIAKTINARVDTRASLKAHTTQARMGAAVAGAMPFVVLAILKFLSPEYLDPMLESPYGTFLLMLAVILVFIGWYSIKRISDIRMN